MSLLLPPTPLKIIFAGSPEFAAVVLEALLNTPHQLVAVYTQPDRPAGRGQHCAANPVKQLALAHHLPVLQPLSLKDPIEQATLAKFAADIMIVAAYGLILPRAVLKIPPLGCLNVHASLLPRWRGASPIQAAILAGDSESGVTIMQMAAGLDTGDMLYKVSCPLNAKTTTASLHDELAQLGAKALISTLEHLIKGNLNPQVQTEAAATYAGKINKTDANINWQTSAQSIDRLIRAYQPWPVAYSYLGAQTVRIWHAQPQENVTQAAPGTVIKVDKKGVEVATAAGILSINQLQFPGKKVLPISALVNASTPLIKVGQQFQSEPNL